MLLLVVVEEMREEAGDEDPALLPLPEEDECDCCCCEARRRSAVACAESEREPVLNEFAVREQEGFAGVRTHHTVEMGALGLDRQRQEISDGKRRSSRVATCSEEAKGSDLLFPKSSEAKYSEPTASFHFLLKSSRPLITKGTAFPNHRRALSAERISKHSQSQAFCEQHYSSPAASLFRFFFSLPADAPTAALATGSSGATNAFCRSS